jgi:ABC-type sugar transport system ATPase subunit
MADRIAVMNLGVLQQYGSPDEIYNRPANRFVAGFVGSTQMNFLPVSELNLAAPSRANGSGTTAGIRPERLRIVAPDAGEAILRGKVSLVEPLGAKDVIHLSVDGYDVRVVGVPGLRPRIGENVGVAVETDQVHFFDDETGKALA